MEWMKQHAKKISNKMMGDEEWYFAILTISRFSLAYIRISGRQ
jgi:hypothetical protein